MYDLPSEDPEECGVPKELLRPTDLVIGKANPGKAQQKLGWQAKYRMPDVVRMMMSACQSEK